MPNIIQTAYVDSSLQMKGFIVSNGQVALTYSNYLFSMRFDNFIFSSLTYFFEIWRVLLSIDAV